MCLHRLPGTLQGALAVGTCLLRLLLNLQVVEGPVARVHNRLGVAGNAAATACPCLWVPSVPSIGTSILFLLAQFPQPGEAILIESKHLKIMLGVFNSKSYNEGEK